MIDFDHYEVAALSDPLPTLNELRERCPVAKSTAYGGFWNLFDYELVHAAARDTDRLSSRQTVIPQPEAMCFAAPPIQIDPPVHDDFRKPVLRFFSPHSVRELDAAIRARATQLIDEFIGSGEADLATQLCIPFPAEGAIRLLGLPPEDFPVFADWSVKIFRNDDLQDVMANVLEYFGRYYDEAGDRTDDSIISVCRRLTIGGEPITRTDFSLFLMTLVAAGLDTTANAAAHIFIVLDEHPALRTQLIEDPSRMPRAIEELLRYLTPLPTLSRVARADMTIGESEIRQGELVMLNWLAANHDPKEFRDPGEIDFDRAQNRHMAFGSGIHRCLGMHLARLELRILLEEVLQRMPDYLVRHDDVLRVGGITRMVCSLPVRFTPGALSGSRNSAASASANY